MNLLIGIAIFTFCMAMFLLMVFVVASFVRDQMEARRMFDIHVNDHNNAVRVWMNEWRELAQKDADKVQDIRSDVRPDTDLLHKNLADALAREDYEAAAKYRDEINRIQRNEENK